MAKTKSDIKEIKEDNKPSKTENEKKYNRFMEEIKVTSDYLKHVATLDTGSILIMATFLQKSTKLGAGVLVAIAAFCFILSLVGAIAAQGLLVLHASRNVDNANNFPSTSEKKLYRFGVNLGYFSFVVGIATLAVFIFYTLSI